MSHGLPGETAEPRAAADQLRRPLSAALGGNKKSIMAWVLDNIPNVRRKLLLKPFEFASLIADIHSQLQGIAFQRDKGQHEAKGLWRPVFGFEVPAETFDRFFNSQHGYRGQYWHSAEKGRTENHTLISAISNNLIASIGGDVAVREQVKASLDSGDAKIWIDEKHHDPPQPKLLLQVRVPTWEAAAVAVFERLNNYDPTLSPKEIDRIFGVRAPTGTTLRVMGAWIRPDGSIWCVPSKACRAEEIHAYGVS